MTLFGVRSLPTDIETSIADLEKPSDTYKHSVPNIQPSADVLSKRKNSIAATVLDWNSGATPIDAWLNQSAIPVSNPESPTLESDQYMREREAKKLEERDFIFYRKVHFDTAFQDKASHLVVTDTVDSNGLAAQVYCRNIMDRYPSVPPYLARRIAGANVKRTDRLSSPTVPPEDAPIVIEDRNHIIGQVEDWRIAQTSHQIAEHDPAQNETSEYPESAAMLRHA